MNDIWKFCIRMGIVGLLVCFGIFYGVDLATHGLGETSGRSIGVSPGTSGEWTGQGPGEVAGTTDPQQTGNADRGEGQDPYPYRPPYDPLTPAQEPTLVSLLADVTGNVLQRTARGSIELIVSLFDGILH
jgi:Neuraminidase (sialidase)